MSDKADDEWHAAADNEAFLGGQSPPIGSSQVLATGVLKGFQRLQVLL